MSKVDKTAYYLGIAEAVSRGSTCIRRKYGAVIVKDDRVVSTGFNGAARGDAHCSDKGSCWRSKHNIPHGERYEKCRSVHAEMNAIINANPADLKGATLYLVGFEGDEKLDNACPCEMCSRFIVNSGIDRLITDRGYQYTMTLLGGAE